MVAAVRNEARDLANFESDLQIITIDTMQAAATKILPTSPSSSYRRPTYPFYSFRRLPPCAVFPIFPQDFLRPRTLLKPSYEMGRMRSRRRNVPGRTWPKEERTGGGGDGAASSSPRLTRRRRRLRVAQALVTLSLSRASWIFFPRVWWGEFFSKTSKEELDGMGRVVIPTGAKRRPKIRRAGKKPRRLETRHRAAIQADPCLLGIKRTRPKWGEMVLKLS
jgi:hypothetical protein